MALFLSFEHQFQRWCWRLYMVDQVGEQEHHGMVLWEVGGSVITHPLDFKLAATSWSQDHHGRPAVLARDHHGQLLQLSTGRDELPPDASHAFFYVIEQHVLDPKRLPELALHHEGVQQVPADGTDGGKVPLSRAGIRP